MPATTSETLQVAVDQVERGLLYARSEVGAHDWNDRTWHERHRAALTRLAEALTDSLGAGIADGWQGAKVRICGIASTSTSGIEGALTNWLRAARLRLEALS